MTRSRPPISDRPLNAMFEREEQISEGGHSGGAIFIVRCRRDGEEYVEKTLKTENIIEGQAETEMKFLRSLRHPYIVEFVAGCIHDGASGPEGSLYQEYCDRGDMERMVQGCLRRGAGVPEKAVAYIFSRMIMALEYLAFGIQNVMLEGRAACDPD